MFKMNFKIFKFVILSLLPVVLSAANLKEFINLSLNNEEYLIKQLKSEQARLEKERVLRDYLPSLSLSSAYVSNHKDRFIIDPKESLYAKFSLNFLLFDGGAREANIRLLQSKERFAFLDEKEQKNYTSLSAVTLYFNALSLEKILLANKQKVQFLKNSFEMNEKFYNAGLKSKDELESIRARYHLSELELSQNELKMQELKRDIVVLSGVEFNFFAGATLAQIDDEKPQNYELLMTKEELFMAKQNVSLAKSFYFPKFFIQNNFSFYNNDYSPKIPAVYMPLANELLDKNSNTNQFILGMEWKIFDFNARAKEVEKRRLSYQILSSKLRLKERKNEQDLLYLKNSLRFLKEQINALNSSLKAANLAYESIEKKYFAGLVSYVEYLQILESKFKAMSDLEFAKNELEIAKANYYFTAGIDIFSKVIE